MPNSDGPVLIAGAGIGGLATALALHQSGFPVEVYERREGRKVELGGTGLTIWSNAATALDGLGLGEACQDLGVKIESVQHYRANNDLMYEMRTERYEWPDSRPSIGITRAALTGVLLEACESAGIPLHFGRSCTGVENDGTQVNLQLTGGERVSGRALIGADGVGSAVRDYVVADGQPDYLGVTVFRGISDAAEAVGRGVVHMFEARKRPGLVGMGWHVGGERVNWTIGRLDMPQSHADPKAQALDLVRDVAGPAREIVRQTPADAIVITDLVTRRWVESWSSGRIVLLGDAAHAMPTVFGQGACQALEDALTMGSCLRGASTIESGLRSFEAQRLERVRWVRSQVIRTQRMQQLRNPLLRRLRNQVAPFIIRRKQDELWRGFLQPPATARAALDA